MTSNKVFKIGLWVAISIALAILVAVFLASPVMSALGMTAIGT